MKRADYKATEIKATTKKGADILDDARRAGYGDIWTAYNKPSSAKVRAYQAIARRASETDGYNYDLRVSGAGIQNYSTIYTFTEDGTTYVVKDTACNTYIVAK